MWLEFLYHPTIYSRPFMDFNSKAITANEVDMYSDSSANPELRFGATCSSSWMYSQWDCSFVKKT